MRPINRMILELIDVAEVLRDIQNDEGYQIFQHAKRIYNHVSRYIPIRNNKIDRRFSEVGSAYREIFFERDVFT